MVTIKTVWKFRGIKRAKEIFKLQGAKKSHSFLEIGCWDGMVSGILCRNGKDVTAIDKLSEGLDEKQLLKVLNFSKWMPRIYSLKMKVLILYFLMIHLSILAIQKKCLQKLFGSLKRVVTFFYHSARYIILLLVNMHIDQLLFRIARYFSKGYTQQFCRTKWFSTNRF